MIGNITKGTNFKGLFEYLLHPNKQAEVIGGNVGIGSPAELEAEFIAFSSRNDRVKKVVTHISLGFAPQDGELESAQLDRIAERITEELGYRNAQYLAIRHGRHDPGHDAPHDHDHFHIVCNSVSMNGQWVDDFQCKRRLEKILRQIEQDEKLTQIKSSWEVKRRAPTHGQQQRYKRELREVEAGMHECATLPVSDRLQLAIDNAAQASSTVVDFAQKLAEHGITTKLKVTRNGVVKGISYSLEEVSFQGNQLYDASLPKLQSIRGLDFDSKVDPARVHQIVVNQSPQPIFAPIVPTVESVESNPLMELFAAIRESKTTDDAFAALIDLSQRNAVAKQTMTIAPPSAILAPDAANSIPVLSLTPPTSEKIELAITPDLVTLADPKIPAPLNQPEPPSRSAPMDSVAEPVVTKTPNSSRSVSASLSVPKDPSKYNADIRRKAEQERQKAIALASKQLAALKSQPKRNLLNWNGLTKEEFAKRERGIKWSLKKRLAEIDRIVRDNLKPTPPTYSAPPPVDPPSKGSIVLSNSPSLINVAESASKPEIADIPEVKAPTTQPSHQSKPKQSSRGRGGR